MEVTKNIFYVGVNDYDIELFEGQFHVEKGMAYNSYLICDEKIAVLDTVDKNFGDKWFSNLEKILNGKKPDFLVVHHMEPDHSANIDKFMKKFPEAKVVSGAKSFAMMKQFFGDDYSDRQVVVGEGDKLSLGECELTFFTAPMVYYSMLFIHWIS